MFKNKADSVKTAVVVGLLIISSLMVLRDVVFKSSEVGDLLQKVSRLDLEEFTQFQRALHNHIGVREVSLEDDAFIVRRDDTEKKDEEKDEEKDDSKDDSNDDNDDDKDKKSTPVLDMVGVRVLLAFGGIVFLNMFVIFVHHLYMLATRTEKSYRSVEQTLSPY